jgi:hypothetical protein
MTNVDSDTHTPSFAKELAELSGCEEIKKHIQFRIFTASCGTRVASYSNSAIVMLHSTDAQILPILEAFLCPSIEAKTGVSS